MSVPFAVFGPGILILTRTDLAPVPGAPINVGYVQEFEISTAGTTKPLYGQKQYPLVAARGTVKVTGKLKAATISGFAWNSAFYGQTSFSSTGTSIAWNIDSTFTTSTTSSAVLVGSSLTYDADLGVKYSTTGLPLQRVSTGNEATGKYSVITSTASGQLNQYNFAGTDGGAGGNATNLKITYTSLTGPGQTLRVTNQLIGFTPTFQLDYYTNLNQPNSKPFIVRMYQGIGAKHMMSFKLEDFYIPEFDFDLFANASDIIYDLVFPEQS